MNDRLKLEEVSLNKDNVLSYVLIVNIWERIYVVIYWNLILRLFMWEKDDWMNDRFQRSIAVMGHIGLTPQSVNVLGGFKIQGKSCIGN